MLRRFTRWVRNEQGIETLEWIAMGAIILAVALAVYPGSLADAINVVIAAISGKLDT